MWNGLRTQEALEGGLFGKTNFLKVGTAEEPCPYDAKDPLRNSYKGKQFGTQAPKPLFDSTCKPVFEGETYVDRMPYHELQPEKPGKGFLTSDFSKRDEYSLTLQAERYRQQIQHEARVQKLAEEKLTARSSAAAAGSTAQAQQAQHGNRDAPLLFDLVFEGEADLCVKAKRDTRNPTALSKERKLGTFKTTNSLTQSAAVLSPMLSATEAGTRANGSPAQQQQREQEQEQEQQAACRSASA